jgi:UDPglucose 6-dehydrogenase
MMNQKIGIIGLGFLGGAMDEYFTKQGMSVCRYDKKGIGSEAEVNRADIIFICVNTPFDEEKQSTDLSFVESAVKLLTGEKIVVLRSTIPPGTTDDFQRRFPQHRFLFNPEFLRAATAAEDFKNPPRQVIGTTEKSKSVAGDIMMFLPKAPEEYTTIVSARAAELLKYAANTMLATKVALANKIFDLSQKLDVHYEDIKNLLKADARIGSYGLDIFYEGFRGYNGTCFPKDVRSLIASGEKMGVSMAWLKAMDDENLMLLRSQGLLPNYGYPEGHSKK